MCIFCYKAQSAPPSSASVASAALSCRLGLHDHFISRAPSCETPFCARGSLSCTWLTLSSFPLQ